MNSNQNTNIFIHENASEIIVCEMASILSREDELKICRCTNVRDMKSISRIEHVSRRVFPVDFIVFSVVDLLGVLHGDQVGNPVSRLKIEIYSLLYIQL